MTIETAVSRVSATVLNPTQAPQKRESAKP